MLSKDCILAYKKYQPIQHVWEKIEYISYTYARIFQRGWTRREVFEVRCCLFLCSTLLGSVTCRGKAEVACMENFHVDTFPSHQSWQKHRNRGSLENKDEYCSYSLNLLWKIYIEANDSLYLYVEMILTVFPLLVTDPCAFLTPTNVKCTENIHKVIHGGLGSCRWT